MNWNFYSAHIYNQDMWNKMYYSCFADAKSSSTTSELEVDFVWHSMSEEENVEQ